MKFTIKGTGKVYDAADLDLIPLRDILLFEQQTKDMGRAVEWSQIEAWGEQLDALKTDDEKARHPGAMWLTAVTVWASRRIAGENVNFDEAVNIPMRDLVFLPDPQDRKAAANPTTARRTGSGRAAKPRAAAAGAASGETSAAASTSDS